MTKEINKFINFIFADKTDKETVCVSKASPKDDGQTLFWNLWPEHEVFAKWSARAKRSKQAWYFCVSTTDGTLNDKETALRRRRGDLVRYHCLVLDDIGTKAEAPPVEPAWKMETSAGNWQWGYLIEPGSDWGRYEALIEWCSEQGWGDGGAGGSYRLMRLPWSCNLKDGRDKWLSAVEYISGHDDVWQLQGLAEELGCDLDALPVKSSSTSVSTERGGVVDGIDPLFDWLVEAGHVVKDGGDWVDIICPWAAEHTSGSDRAGYSPLGAGDGGWVQTRAFRCLHEHCSGRRIKEFVEWAVARGGPWVAGYDPLPWLQARYAYVGMPQQVVDLVQRGRGGGDWIWELPAWKRMHPGKIDMGDGKISVSDAFISHEATVKAESYIYLPIKPDEDTGVITHHEQNLINTYRPPIWPETDMVPETFLAHVAYLTPSLVEREVFLDWLAFIVQEPARRSFAVCMVAERTFGVGRSHVGDMMKMVLQGKVNSASLGQLIGKGTSAENNYNDWIAGCQLLIVEEAKDDIDRETFYAGLERFKQIVDTRVKEVRVNPKYGKIRDEYIYWCCLMFTNHIDALALEAKDRRVYVIQNPQEMKTPAYYEALAASLNRDEAAALFWWLMRRDITKFDHIYPPMTPGKLAMIEVNAAPSDRICEWIQDTLKSDIITMNMLRKHVILGARHLNYDAIMDKPGGVIRHIWGRCGNLRGETRGARYMVNGVQTEVRAIRELGKWKMIDDARDRKLVVDEMAKDENVSNVIALPSTKH